MKKFKFYLTSMAIAAIFAACSDDDDNNSTPDNPNGEVRDEIIASQDDPDWDPEALFGDVTGNVTLSADTEWNLTGALEVKENATLTIEPGTVIRAAAGGTDVYIAIEQGAKIDAQGTATEPILITSAAANPRSGDWGGLMLAGYAPINTGDTAETEVAGITYGGNDAADNSGKINYLILEYTGARIGGEQEFNGLTLYGVGNGTSVKNIVINNGDDDGIEWFGGTVNVENALVINAKDDWFDWTEGWNGEGTNFYGLRRVGFNDVTEDPRGIEADNNSNNNDASPRSNPTITNLTLHHQSTITMADMIKIRRGSSVTINNGLVAIVAAEGEDAGEASDFIDLTDGSGPASSMTEINVSAIGDIDATDIKNEVGATINVTPGNTGTDKSIFDWATQWVGELPNLME